MSGVGAAYCFGSRLRQADVSHVTGGDHFRDGPDCLLDWHLWVHPAKAIDVDVIGAEPAQGIGQEIPDRHWSAVDADEGIVGSAKCSKLHTDDYAVPVPAAQRVPNEQLIVPHAVVIAG